MATTAQLIREKQRDLIQDLAPSQIAGTPFREHDLSQGFEQWAESSPHAALRKFQIVDLASYETVAGDMVSHEVETEFEITVAYPVDYRYGSDGINGLADIIETDRVQIETAIGILGYGDYVSGHNRSALVEHSIDKADDIWLSVSVYEVNFRRTVNL